MTPPLQDLFISCSGAIIFLSGCFFAYRSKGHPDQRNAILTALAGTGILLEGIAFWAFSVALP